MMDGIAKGQVVLIRARVHAVHAGQGIACVRIAEADRFGGPGFRAEVISLAAIASVENDPPSDPELVPPEDRR